MGAGGGDECSVWAYLLSEFLRRSIIYSTADLVPPHIGVCQKPFVNRRCGSQSQQDRSKWTELVVHLATFGDVLGLESDLKTTAAHAKSHGIHMNEIVWGGAVPYIIILGPVVKIMVDSRVLPWPRRILVLEHRHIDLDFLSSPPADIRCQRGKTNMRICDLVWDELRAQPGARHWIVRIGEDTRPANHGIRRESDGKLVRSHVVFGNHPSQFHVWLHVEEFPKLNAPWLAWCCLQHESTKLGMEDWQRFTGASQTC